MSDELEFSIDANTLEYLILQKKEMGFGQKSWDEWFNFMFRPDSNQKVSSDQTQLETIIGKTITDNYYELWVKNFAMNLNDIWSGRSAKDLEPNKENNHSSINSAIVIGAGPSLKKHEHLKLLANSNYKGAIICTDRVLADVLKSGVTPDKFPKFFVATIDPKEVIKNFYSDEIITKYGNKINAIFSTVIHPAVVEKAKQSKMKIYWLHALIDYHEGKKSFNQISGLICRAKNHVNGLPAIQTGGNVGTSSWFIGWKILKCSTIGLIGINFGWNDDDSIEEILSHVNAPLDMDRNSDIFKKSFPRIYNPEFKCYCIQNPIYQYYTNAFKEFIIRAPENITTINATEGGVIFGDRINCMTFKKFLELHNN